ncbi:hypothetical protein SASPL_121672 [Salvia splendens]|uniref:Sec1 family domain-containing protein MIP3 n=1 Tax=Salvia splendens TaxID=180675 RepID=A0A8X8XWI7_SALSN|nr:sec1 family domain-containing protein MIP3-like [Salvia splendens]KAG6419450.1 hypothetical protein SASPL_121672 [Salvia splendens]
MATVDVIKCCHDSIRQASENIKDAIVYLDAGTAESFQFLGAFPLLLELGARAVCSLENMSVVDKVVDWNTGSDPASKIVVITSCLLSDAHRYSLRCLSALQNVHGCAVYTSISEVSHSAYPDSPLGPDAFREYEILLNQDYEELVKKHERPHTVVNDSGLKEGSASEEEGWWELTDIDDDSSRDYGISNAKHRGEDYFSGSEDVGQKLVVSVHHFPLILCPLSPRVFVLPSEGSTAEASLSSEHESSISSGLPPLSAGKLADAEDVSPGANLTAQFLYHLALKMDLKLEIFSLGDLSKNVGKLMTDMSSLYDVGRRKRSAGLLLIDRTLDLLTPCCHGDSLVDRMFASLPRMQPASSLSLLRGSQSQLKISPHKVERARLTVQIPLDKYIVQEDKESSNFQLLENIEAFLNGWDAFKSDAPSADFMKFRKNLNDESCFQLNESKLLHGSFVSTDNFRGAQYLEAILDRRTKDGAMLVKKWLQECLRQESPTPNMNTRPGLASKSDLQSMLRSLAKRQSSFVKNKGIIQLAAATVHALDESHSASWDAFNSAEKILHVNAADTSQSLAAQISDLINKTVLAASRGQKHNKSQGLFTLEDALLLTVIGYILAGENFPTSGSGGPFTWQEEHFMKEAIVDAILENPTVSRLKLFQGLLDDLEAKTKLNKKNEDPSGHSDAFELDDDQWDSWGDDDADKDTSKDEAYSDMQLKLELRDRVDNLFKFLHKLSGMKGNSALREGMSALESRRNDDPSSTKGLLYKILTNVLDHNPIPGMEYHSSTVGRLFKSGFGRFGIGQAKPSLSDHNIILVFVVGGINAVEVREVQEAIARSSRPDVEVLLGGTTLLTPDDMRELLFGDYSHI